ncbi:hypothetical protein E2C01_097769 [Portunus trituberculatus]|jgi:hypothetical protein
MHVF